jgi:phosphoribosylformylglycinamidine (FGAM) synthase-like enzyme
MLRLPRRPLFRQTALVSTLLLSVACLPTLQGMGQSARAEGSMGEIVKAFCLSAFESEMIQSGKTPPAGMANFACGCVADRIGSGSTIASARSDCRQATARRYPI